MLLIWHLSESVALILKSEHFNIHFFMISFFQCNDMCVGFVILARRNLGKGRGLEREVTDSGRVLDWGLKLPEKPLKVRFQLISRYLL